MRIARAVLVVLSVLSLEAARAQAAGPAATVVTVVSVHGEVLVRRAPGSATEPLLPLASLGRRDEVETHAGDVQLKLPSGAVIELGPDGLLAILTGPVDGYLARGTLRLYPGPSGEVGKVTIATGKGRTTLQGPDTILEVKDGQTQVLSAPPAPPPAPPPPPAAIPAVQPPPPAPPPPPPPPVVIQFPAEIVQTNPKTLPTAFPVAAPPAAPPPVAEHPFAEFTTLRLLQRKGLISQEELDMALRDTADTAGTRIADSITLRLGRWATTLYGFVQADIIWHSTRSFNDYAGNLQVARPGTPAGDNGRTQFSARDTRFGLRIQPPELSWLRASAVIEMDFLGPTPNNPAGGMEGSFFNNPVLRFRHAFFKMETPVVDVLFGHTWHLFGWQPNYIPADVQWSGVVAALFSRTVQLRISKTIKTRPVTLELAVAGSRPPQRDSQVPEFEAGARLSFNQWTAVHTGYMTITNTAPASIGVSGDLRHFSLPEFSAAPKATNAVTGLGIAVDAFVPLLRGTKEHKDNSLSLIGEYVNGQGINDLYVGLTGGVTSPLLPGVNGAPGTAFEANVDPGLAVYDINGQLRLPHWQTFVVGAEYYPPKVGGRLGLFFNYTHSQLLDSHLYANPTKTRDNESFYNGGIFADVSEAIRFGVDYAYIDDVYADGVHAPSHLVQGTGFLFF